MTQTIEITGKFFIETFVDANDRPCAKLVQNTPKAKYRKTKTLKNYWFGTEVRRDEWVQEQLTMYKKQEDFKQDRRNLVKELVKTVQIEVGAIFVYSWGWEQTNINFYEVTKVKGQTLELQELYQNRQETGWLQGTCTPIKGSFKKDEKPWVKRIKVLADGKPYVSTEFGWCSLWDGTEEHWTAYA